MARLNVYLPDDLHALANKWRGAVNLSEICARALRDELQAVETVRSPLSIGVFRRVSPLESSLISQFGLADAVCAPNGDGSGDLREVIGKEAAAYLDRHLTENSLLGVGGGRQTWCMVRNLSPRRVRISITALGIQQNDPQVLHAHPNTLITLLSLLYGPSAKAHLVGAPAFDEIWQRDLPKHDQPKYFVVASSGPFSPKSPFTNLLGQETSQFLFRRHACGDFAYVFFTGKGELIDSIPMGDQRSSIMSAAMLQGLSVRSDARVMLVAGGDDKLKVIRLVLRAKLCNVLITDAQTAGKLLDDEEA